MNIDPKALFTEDNAVNRGTFFKFQKVRDRLYGTYTGHRVGQDGFGNEQFIIEVLTPEGEYKLVGTKRRGGQASILEKYMQSVKLGQVIGLELTEKRQTRAGNNPANIITPYSDGKMNQEWLSENKSLAEELEEELEEESFAEAQTSHYNSVEEVPFETEKPKPASGTSRLASPAPAILSKEEKVKEIGELAQKKLGATDATDIKTKVMEATEIPFLEKNLDKILTTLRDL